MSCPRCGKSQEYLCADCQAKSIPVFTFDKPASNAPTTLKIIALRDLFIQQICDNAKDFKAGKISEITHKMFVCDIVKNVLYNHERLVEIPYAQARARKQAAQKRNRKGKT